MKGEISKSTHTVGDFNIFLSITDNTNRKRKVPRDTDLNNMINELDTLKHFQALCP
jgi:hypothetical protein